MLKDLINIANKLDAIGLTKEADKIDFLIKKVSQELEPLPRPGIDQEYLDRAMEKDKILKSEEQILSNDTKDAVIQIQRYLGLPPTGIWNKITDDEFITLIINFAKQFPQKINEGDIYIYIEKLFRAGDFNYKTLEFTKLNPKFVGTIDDALRLVFAIKDIMQGSTDWLRGNRRVIPVDPTSNKTNPPQEPVARTQTTSGTPTGSNSAPGPSVKENKYSRLSEDLRIIRDVLLKKEFIGKDQFNRITYDGRSFNYIMGFNADSWMQIHDRKNFFLLVGEPEKVNYKNALKAYYDKAIVKI